MIYKYLLPWKVSCFPTLPNPNPLMLWSFKFWSSLTYLRKGNGSPLQYSCLENPRRAWWAAVYGVAQGWTRLSDFTFSFPFHALEKERATHSSVLAWRIPGSAEPGGLPSMGLHRVGYDWSDLATAAFIYFFFCCLCFWCHMQEITTKSNVIQFSPYAFF